MAQKINPNSFRLGLTIPWQSRWFFKRNLRFFLEEDHLIREIIKDKILSAGIHAIEIERAGGETARISIKAARPGLIIGRGGKGIEDLKNWLTKAIRKLRSKNKIAPAFSLNLNVEELGRGEVSAAVVAQQIAFDLEKRLPYRRVIKRQIETLAQNRDIKGVKIRVGGRLNGAEISRNDWLARGRMPLQTLRANINYGEATAFNSYGTVGIKVWLYKGEVFSEKSNERK
ncbi:MAG: 30S ribosomal protein S3 [Patescibacteria group bacterium]